MKETGRPNNVLGVFCGNGANEVGQLFVSESGIYWNDTNTLLYGSKPGVREKKIFVKNPAEIRIVWKPKGETAGGFYVWLGDQLIGEALSGTTNPAVVDAYKNSFLIGDIGNAYAVDAEISDIAFDADFAFAPEQK